MSWASDLFKSYVRMPDIQQKMIVDYAHSVGELPSPRMKSHPAAFSMGWTALEHTTATSRRGVYYSDEGDLQPRL